MQKFYTRILGIAAGVAALAGVAYAALPEGSLKLEPLTSRIRTVKAEKGSTGLTRVQPAGSAARIEKIDSRPERLPGQPVDLYGSVLFSDGDYSKSLYKWPVTTTGSPELVIPGVQALGAFIDNDMYYALLPGDGYYEPASVKVYDMKTGSKLYEWSGMDASLMNFGIDKDPVTGDYYGVFYDSDAYGVELATVTFDGAKPTRTKTIGTLNSGEGWYGFSINSEGEMYGITGNPYDGAYLYKINRNTAQMTKVGSTTIVPTDNTSACFDRETNTLYWTVCTEGYYDEPAYLTTVNTSTGKATKIYRLPGDERVGGLAIPRSSAAAGAPAECENVQVSFSGASLSGSVTLRAPSRLVNGSNGSGDLTIKVKANDSEVASVAAAWGADVTIPITMTAPGKYDFSIYGVNAEGDGKAVSVNGLFVGPDAPEAPVATLQYADSKMTVSWSEVSTSVNGGWIDVENLTYDVTRYPGAVEVAAGLKATSFTEDFPEPEAGVRVYYEVVAVSGQYKSAPGKTNEIALGSIVPPYNSEFGTSGLADYTIIDANHDGNKFQLTGDDGGTVRIRWNSSMAMDDWLITPAFLLEAGKSYEFEVSAASNGQSYPERLEVLYGTAPTAEAMTTQIIPVTEIATTAQGSKKLTGQIVPAATGKYYIGFHGCSEADQYYLYIKNYSIKGGVSLPLPQPVSNLTVTPAADYSLSAVVSFTAPSQNVYDENMDALTKVEVLRGEEVVRTFDNPAPGASLEFTDNVPEIGTYTYTVIPYNDYGAGASMSASAYVGAPLPGSPKNVRIARTSTIGEVQLSWDAVTEDADGNPMNSSAVTYGIGFPTEEGWIISVDHIAATTYTVQICGADEQVFAQVAVFPITAAGVGLGSVAPLIPVGKPYTSVFENFADAKFNHIWGVDTSQGGRWSLASVENSSTYPPADDDVYVLAMQGSNLDNSADIFSGLIDLGDMDYPGMSFMVYNQSTSENGANLNEVIVSVKTENGNTFVPVLHKKVEELAGPKSWKNVFVDLAPYANDVVQVMLTVIVKQYSTTLFDDIYVGSTEVVLPAPTGLTASNETTHVALSWTKPEFDPNSPLKEDMLLGYQVYRDEELLNEEYLSEPSYTDSAITPQTTYQYYVKAVYPTGESDASNIVTMEFVIELPAPTGLDAESQVDGVKLTWEKPVIEAASLVKENDLTGYRIFKGEDVLANVGSDEMAYTDSDVVPGEEYEYSVIAVYSYGLSESTEIKKVTYTTTLPAPSGLTAADAGEYVELAWLAPQFAEDGVVKESALIGYDIYRDGIRLNAEPVDALTFHDETVVKDTEYSYYVKAVYSYGESEASETVVIAYSAIGSVEGDAIVSVAPKTIIVAAAEGRDVVVVCADGTVVYAAKGEARAAISVAPGVYMVKVGRMTRKVVVR